MKIYIPVLVAISIALTSCSSNKETPSTAFEELQASILKSYMDDGPAMDLYVLISGYKEANKEYPDTIEELNLFYQTHINESSCNPYQIKTLSITRNTEEVLEFLWKDETYQSTKTLFIDRKTGNATASWTMQEFK